MTTERLLLPLDRSADRLGNQAGRVAEIGNKADSLQRLRRLGMRVPAAYVVTGAAYLRCQRGDPTLREALAREIESRLDLTRRYAVRSSANLEDSSDFSFAGQFVTVLDVSGGDALLNAVWSVWESARTAPVREYMRKNAIPEEGLRMAVIIQEMVHAVASGVAFSRNPITGARETVIEAVAGAGDRLMQDGITPERWTFSGGSLTSAPASDLLSPAVLAEIERETRALARRVGKPLDLEWVYDGSAVYWVQMREITSLKSMAVYSNKIAREMIGGMIKPLVWSINIPMVIGAKIRLLTQIIGPNDLEPFTLARQFHYRAYFNMGQLGEIFESVGIPAESLEMMMGIAPSSGFKMKPGPRAMHVMPRLIVFMFDKLGLSRRLPAKLAGFENAFRAVDFTAIRSLPLNELVREIDRLFLLNQEVAYYNIVIPITMHIYNAILRSQLKKVGIDAARLDMQTSSPEFQQLYPASQLERLHRLYSGLPPAQQELVRAGMEAELEAIPDAAGFRDALGELMLRFGHLCDNGNDFSTVPWRENRSMILRLIADYQPRPEDDSQKLRFEDLRLPSGQGWMFQRLYRHVRSLMLFREKTSYLYTYGYGLFRACFLAAGEIFCREGWLDDPTDIFYLDWPAIRKVAEAGAPADDLRAVVAGQKAEMERVRAVAMPEIVYGDNPPPVQRADARRLTGTATSRGYCTGPVRVVTGLQDFGKVTSGDILVIPFSDVGWAPLFARAAGVIAEAGGILSHSSIIAREYGIPAVVSVPYAMQLTDGTLVTIDGYKGEIIVHEEEEISAGT